jgi:methylenetetrahydromethanopterin dehydrogenase
MIGQKPDLVILVGPAQTTAGPTEARNMLKDAEIPTIMISDSPAKKLAKESGDSGLGFIIVEADSMIGARREFLDPAEMAVYNTDVIRVLAATGAFNLIVETIDGAIKSIKAGEKPQLPRLIIDGERAVESAGFSNPYARAKALAAYQSAQQVSRINTEACFRVSDPSVYVPLVATAHEMMRSAARLADEAREIEKTGDSVLRKPHFKDGTIGAKRTLMGKPKKGQ